MLGSGGGGGLGGGNSLVAGEHAVTALWVVQSGLCFLLICIVVVTVPFVFCSVKLPLSRPTSFCLFLSILLRTPADGGAAAWRFCCWPQPNHNIKPYFTCVLEHDLFQNLKESMSSWIICVLLLIYSRPCSFTWILCVKFLQQSKPPSQ